VRLNFGGPFWLVLQLPGWSPQLKTRSCAHSESLSVTSCLLIDPHGMSHPVTAEKHILSSLRNSCAGGPHEEKIELLARLLPKLVTIRKGGSQVNRSGALAAIPGYIAQYFHTCQLALENGKAFVCPEISGDIVVVDFSTNPKPKLMFVSDKSGDADDIKKSAQQLRDVIVKLDDVSDMEEICREFDDSTAYVDVFSRQVIFYTQSYTLHICL
jgi:hypothetical protein